MSGSAVLFLLPSETDFLTVSAKAFGRGNANEIEAFKVGPMRSWDAPNGMCPNENREVRGLM